MINIPSRIHTVPVLETTMDSSPSFDECDIHIDTDDVHIVSRTRRSSFYITPSLPCASFISCVLARCPSSRPGPMTAAEKDTLLGGRALPPSRGKLTVHRGQLYHGEVAAKKHERSKRSSSSSSRRGAGSRRYQGGVSYSRTLVDIVESSPLSSSSDECDDIREPYADDYDRAPEGSAIAAAQGQSTGSGLMMNYFSHAWGKGGRRREGSAGGGASLGGVCAAGLAAAACAALVVTVLITTGRIPNAAPGGRTSWWGVAEDGAATSGANAIFAVAPRRAFRADGMRAPLDRGQLSSPPSVDPVRYDVQAHAPAEERGGRRNATVATRGRDAFTGNFRAS